MPRRCDIWRIGVADAPVEAIARAGTLEETAIAWWPEQRAFTFSADPFGLWRDGTLWIFAEAYDYRTRHGVIEVARWDSAAGPVERRTVLAEPWHLSYPHLIEEAGETWMLPEASRSRGLTLYRAARFPDRWERAARLDLDAVPVDATPVRHQGLWWLFYAAAGPRRARAELHAAWAEQLTGPWHPHPANPIRRGVADSRPGGSAFLLDGMLHLPVQDCTRTYGGALRLLVFDRLDPEGVALRVTAPIDAPASAGRYRAGLHTLSGCGPVTLVDVKRVDRTGRGWLIDLRRRLARAAAPRR